MRTPLPDYKLRLSQELKDQISASADANNRSMNSEIIARLERTFREDGVASDARSKLAAQRILDMGLTGRRASTEAGEHDLQTKVQDHEDRISKLETAVLNMLFADDDEPKS